MHYCLLTSWKSSSCRFLTRIILSALLSTVFAQFKTDIVFYKYIKSLFTSFQSHSVIFAVIMVAHCIWKWKTEKFKLNKFEDFKVINKSDVWILAENIWTDEVSLQVTWQCVKSTWYMQSEVQQRIVLQILLDCIYKQIDRSEIKAAVDIITIHNSYANCLNNLSYNRSNNQITSRS